MSTRPDPTGDRLRRFAALPTEVHEVHLRQMKVAPAMEKLERYLNDAAMAGLPRVSVVHGRSGGAMKAAVQGFLESHPLVATYYAAAPSQGGPGVTIAEMK